MRYPSPASLLVRPILIVLLLACLYSRLAQGQVTFFQPPTYSDTADFVADFNGDGKPDLLSKDGTLQLGDGDGTFTMGTLVSGGALAIGDFNGDGKMDVLQLGELVLCWSCWATVMALFSRRSAPIVAPV